MGYASTRPFVAPRSRVSNISNKEWKSQDYSITEETNVWRMHPRFPSNPCRPGPTLRRKSNTNIGSTTIKFTHFEKWEIGIACP